MRRTPHVMRTMKKPGYDVELAVSPLAGMKGAAGYHTSILVAAEEYFFSPIGIVHSATITSHKQNPEMKLIHMGMSRYSGSDLMDYLDEFFPQCHYDLLRKNCNSFSDCALYFLVEQRLDWSFRSLERIGQLADDHAGIVQSISAGEYMPNPRAADFDVEGIINKIKEERESGDGGHGGLTKDFECSGGVESPFVKDNMFQISSSSHVSTLRQFQTQLETTQQCVPIPRSDNKENSPVRRDLFVTCLSKSSSAEPQGCAVSDNHQPQPRCNSRLPIWNTDSVGQGIAGGA